MPHPFAADAIAANHEEFYSASYPEAVQVFSAEERLLNPYGSNPAVLPLDAREKALMGLTEFVPVFRIRVLGRGDITVDELCQASRTWTLSFDNGDTQQAYRLISTISPDASMKCWEFILAGASING